MGDIMTELVGWTPGRYFGSNEFWRLAESGPHIHLFIHAMTCYNNGWITMWDRTPIPKARSLGSIEGMHSNVICTGNIMTVR
jgi:hypothetical protein